jgi:hypothetical protein
MQMPLPPGSKIIAIWQTGMAILRKFSGNFNPMPPVKKRTAICRTASDKM